MTEHDARTLRHLLLTFPALEIRRDAPRNCAVSESPLTTDLQRTHVEPTDTDQQIQPQARR